MDLFRSQRKLIVYLASGFVGFALLVVAAVKLSSGPGKKSTVVSTEAQSSPALSALLADVDRADAAVAPPPVVAPAPAKPASVVPPPPVVEEKVAPPPAPVVEKPAPKPAPKRGPQRVVRRPAPRPKPAPKPVSPTAAAESSALALYRSKDFAKASDTLLAAAGKETGATADRLEGVAKDYASVGVYLGKGDASAAGNPTAAMTAYKQAAQLDARSGKGAHAVYLKAQMAKVAPKAALALYAGGKFEQARETCASASADPACTKLTGMLENKARDLYNQGNALARSKPEEAKNLWRRVLKIVPAESPWYAKSYAALNKAARGKDVDEDE